MNTRRYLTCSLAIAIACVAGNVMAATAVKIDFDKDAIEPNAAQAAAI